LAGRVASLVGKDNCEGFCNEGIDFDLIQGNEGIDFDLIQGT